VWKWRQPEVCVCACVACVCACAVHVCVCVRVRAHVSVCVKCTSVSHERPMVPLWQTQCWHNPRGLLPQPSACRGCLRRRVKAPGHQGVGAKGGGSAGGARWQYRAFCRWHAHPWHARAPGPPRQQAWTRCGAQPAGGMPSSAPAKVVKVQVSSRHQEGLGAAPPSHQGRGRRLAPSLSKPRPPAARPAPHPLATAPHTPGAAHTPAPCPPPWPWPAHGTVHTAPAGVPPPPRRAARPHAAPAARARCAQARPGQLPGQPLAHSSPQAVMTAAAAAAAYAAAAAAGTGAAGTGHGAGGAAVCGPPPAQPPAAGFGPPSLLQAGLPPLLPLPLPHPATGAQPGRRGPCPC